MKSHLAAGHLSRDGHQVTELTAFAGELCDNSEVLLASACSAARILTESCPRTGGSENCDSIA